MKHKSQIYKTKDLLIMILEIKQKYCSFCRKTEIQLFIFDNLDNIIAIKKEILLNCSFLI